MNNNNNSDVGGGLAKNVMPPPGPTGLKLRSRTLQNPQNAHDGVEHEGAGDRDASSERHDDVLAVHDDNDDDNENQNDDNNYDNEENKNNRETTTELSAVSADRPSSRHAAAATLVGVGDEWDDDGDMWEDAPDVTNSSTRASLVRNVSTHQLASIGPGQADMTMAAAASTTSSNPSAIGAIGAGSAPVASTSRAQGNDADSNFARAKKNFEPRKNFPPTSTTTAMRRAGSSNLGAGTTASSTAAMAMAPTNGNGNGAAISNLARTPTTSRDDAMALTLEQQRGQQQEQFNMMQRRYDLMAQRLRQMEEYDAEASAARTAANHNSTGGGRRHPPLGVPVGTTARRVELDQDDVLDRVEELENERRQVAAERALLAEERRRLHEQQQPVRQQATVVPQAPSLALPRTAPIKSRLAPFASGDIVSWLRSFENEAELYGWNVDPALYLRQKLDGVARDFVNGLGIDVKQDYVRLTAALRTRFGAYDRDAELKAKMEKINPSTRDTPTDVWFQLVQLNNELSANKRYTEDALFEDRFLKWITDERQPHVNIGGTISDRLAACERHHRPVALWKSKTTVSSAVAPRAVLSVATQVQVDGQSEDTPIMAVATSNGNLNATAAATTPSDLITRAELEQMLRGHRAASSPSNNNVRRNTQQLLRCLNCNEPGHKWRQCTLPKQPHLLAAAMQGGRSQQRRGAWQTMQQPMMQPMPPMQPMPMYTTAPPYAYASGPLPASTSSQYWQMSTTPPTSQAATPGRQSGILAINGDAAQHQAMAVVEIGGVARRTLFDTGAGASIVNGVVARAAMTAERRTCDVSLNGAFGSMLARDAIRLSVQTPSGVRRFVWFVVVEEFQVDVLLGVEAMRSLLVDVLATRGTIKFNPDAGTGRSAVEAPMARESTPSIDQRTMAIASMAAQVLPSASVLMVKVAGQHQWASMGQGGVESIAGIAAMADPQTVAHGGNWMYLSAAAAAAAAPPPTDDMLAAAIAETLAPDQHAALLDVLKRNRAAFANNSKAPGCTPTVVIDNIINTGDAPPVKERLRKRSEFEDQQIAKFVKQMLENGIVRPSRSPWTSNVHLVKKPNGDVRFTTDYRRTLNARTMADGQPASRDDVAFRRLGRSHYFSKMDCASGFWQLLLSREDAAKTAFVTTEGQFEYNVLPFGPMNAPSAWLRYAIGRLATFFPCGLELFADDLLQHDVDFETHLAHLDSLLAHLALGGPKLGLKKCKFGADSTPYLGHVISTLGVSTDPTKVAAILELAPPETVCGVRVVLGMFNYYRRFIPHFAEIVAPLTALTANVDGVAPRPTRRITWTGECQSAFDALKHALTTAPVLAHPDASAKLELYSDASGVAIAGVLVQRAEAMVGVLEYYSKVLTPAERNYTTSEREALAVVASLSRWRHYVYGRHVDVFTDHAALRFLRSTSFLAGRLMRWALALQEFDITIHHRPGAQMAMVDALTRLDRIAAGGADSPSASDVIEDRLDEASPAIGRLESANGEAWLPAVRFASDDDDTSTMQHAAIMAMAAIELPARNDVANRQRADAAIARLIANVEQRRGDCALYELLDGVLYRVKDGINDDAHRALVIPLADRMALLTTAHDDVSSGHLGLAKTFDRIRRVAWWPGIHGDVRAHVRSCELCAKFSTRGTTRGGYLVNIAGGRPLEIVGVDYVGPLPETPYGNKYILLFVDYYSKWVEAKACESADAATCASAFIELIVSRHGVPRQVVSDRGSQFVSELMDDLFTRLGVRYTPATAYHQQTDGQAERFVQTLMRMLRTCLDHQYAHWDALLPLLMFAYRTAKQSSTGVTPALAVYGRELVSPVEALIGMLPTELTPIDAHVEQLQQLLCEINADVLDHLDVARSQQADGYDKDRRDIEYEVGDLVWVHQEKVGKFGQTWYGPMRVEQRVSQVNYRIVDVEDPNHGEDVVHVVRMKRYHPPPSSLLDGQSIPNDNDATSPPDDGQPEYEIESIRDVREHDGRRQYRVRWRGYTARHDTWIDEAELHAPELLSTFEKVRAIAGTAQAPQHMTRAARARLEREAGLMSGVSGADDPLFRSSSTHIDQSMSHPTKVDGRRMETEK